MQNLRKRLKALEKSLAPKRGPEILILKRPVLTEPVLQRYNCPTMPLQQIYVRLPLSRKFCSVMTSRLSKRDFRISSFWCAFATARKANRLLGRTKLPPHCSD